MQLRVLLVQRLVLVLGLVEELLLVAILAFLAAVDWALTWDYGVMGVTFEGLCCTDSLLDYLKSVISCSLVCNDSLLVELLLDYGVFKFFSQPDALGSICLILNQDLVDLGHLHWSLNFVNFAVTFV